MRNIVGLLSLVNIAVLVWDLMEGQYWLAVLAAVAAGTCAWSFWYMAPRRISKED